MVSMLNPKQKAYLNLDLKDPKNCEYLLTVYHLVPNKLNMLQAAAEVAAESSTGTNFKVNTETAFSREMNALVYKVDTKKNLAYVVGNVLGMKEVKALKLLDVWFPSAMLEQYDGPSYTLDDMRKYLNVYGRPILGTIIKPKIGLNDREYADVCYNFFFVV